MTNKEKVKEQQKGRVLEWLDSRKLERIPLDKLVIPDTGIDHQEALDDAESSILNNGLLVPVSVCGPYDNGTYQVIDGARRIHVFKKMFEDQQIPCYVIDGALTERDVKYLALACNKEHRKSFNSINIQYAQMLYGEYADGLIREHYLSGAISNLTGISSRQARKYLNVVANGSEELIRSVSDDMVGIADANLIVTATADEEKQNRLAELCQSSSYGTKREILKKIQDGTIFEELDKEQDDDEIILNVMQQKMIKKAESSLRCILGSDIPKKDLKKLKKLCKDVCKKY